jgi:hypothetical protein
MDSGGRGEIVTKSLQEFPSAGGEDEIPDLGDQHLVVCREDGEMKLKLVLCGDIVFHCNSQDGIESEGKLLR